MPLLLVNFKNYAQTLGAGGERLAGELSAVAGTLKEVDIALAVSPVDVFRISQAVSLPIFSQHCDPEGLGQTTGFIIPEALKEAGARGTLLNHSERPLPTTTLNEAIVRGRALGLQTVVCVRSLPELVRVVDQAPDYIAYEPPELIGGAVSVTAVKSDVIAVAVKASKNIPLLVGAGVRTGADVERGLELGAAGVLVSSGVVEAADPVSAFKDIAQGFCASAPRG